MNKFFSDYKTGKIFEIIDPSELLPIIANYELAEYEAKVHQHKLIKKDIERF